MERRSRFRTILLVVMITALLAVYTARLFKLQEPAAAGESKGVQTDINTTTIQAARGNILDRNGNILVTNRASYNLQISTYVLFNSANPNQTLLQAAELCRELGLEYVDHLPISWERPYSYTLDDLNSNWQRNFRLFLAAKEWDPDMAPQILMRELKRSYKIPDEWTEEQARMVIGLRYELSLRSVDGTGLEDYILLSDMPAETLAVFMELALPGFSVQTTTVREYRTKYAAHLLGYVGDVWPDEYEQTYKALGYPMNAKVGREGVELAFEQYLHGVDGQKATTITQDGEILDEHWTREPRAGDNVFLSIDINLQEAAEKALESVILDLRENGLPSSNPDAQGKGTDAEGGALVATDIKTGEVLACASYPTFDLSRYFEEFTELSEDPYRPYFNRALSSPQPPGSTFKMVTAIAAIDSEGIGRHFPINDLGKYTYFYDTLGDDYQPECLIYTNLGLTHGVINMMEALEVSCNYYFYEVGRRTKIEAIDNVAKNLGLGEPTGIELPEKIGYRANAETKAIVYKDNPDQSGWYNADTVAAAIGQSENRFTPLQLAVYTSALANGGPRYRATFLRRIVSADYKTLIQENKPELVSDYHFSEEAKKCIQEGMRLAVSGDRGTASLLKDYDVAVCAKTGTAEHGSVGSAHGAFVCYAPADDPQIAIAVYVEKGAQGGNLAKAAMAVMDQYFQSARETDIPKENTVG